MRGLAGCLLWLLGACAVAAGTGDNNGFAVKAPSVSFAPVPPVKVLPGKSAKVDLDFRVSPGFHINSSHPHDELLVPTTLKLHPPTNIMVGRIDYPPGMDMTFDFLPGEKLNVYAGDFRISALVIPTGTVTPGMYRVHGFLKYQACDNRQCYPPREAPADFNVQVQKASRSGTQAQNPAQSPHVH
jgi:hypothetical protein